MLLPSPWYKVLHDIWGNKTRSILIVLSITVGLFAVGTTINARSILAVELAKNYARVNPSSGVVRTLESFGEDFVHSVRRMEEIADADARRIFTVRVFVPQQGQWRDLTVFALKDYEDIRVNKIFPVSGAFPPAKREILIERSSVSFLNVKVGDLLTMETPDRKHCTMRIAGIVHDLVQLPSQIDGNPYGYVSFDGLDCFGEPQGFNELAVVAKNAKDKAHAQQVVNKVKDKAERSGYTIPISLVAEPGQLPLDDVLQTIILVLSGLGLFSLLLSAFLIINTFTSMIAQQIRQIGIMKAVGASRAQIMGLYLAMVLCYALFAMLISIPLGIFGADGLSKFMASYFNFDLTEYDLPTQAISIQILVGLLVPFLSAIYPLWTNLSISAAEAMNAVPMSRALAKINRFELAIAAGSQLFDRFFISCPLIIAFRNTFRSKGRLLLTLATLSFAGAVFTNVFSINASMMRTVDDMMRLYGFDLWITFNKPYRSEALIQEALQIPNAEKADVWLQLASRRVRPDGTESGLIYVFAPDPMSEIILPPTITQGRWLTPQDRHAIVINTNLAKEEPDLQVGGNIILKINGKDEPFTIVGICLGAGAPITYASYNYIAEITSNMGRASSLLIRSNQRDSASIARFSNLAEGHFRKLGYRITNIITASNEREEAQAFFDILTALFLLMALLLAIVGGISLMGTMSINVIERTREIGVMRAVGASDRSVSRVFILEGLFIGCLSWLLGSLLSLGLGKLTSDAVGISLLGVPLSYQFSLLGVGVWLILVVIISAASSIIPARNASQLTVREVLAYE